MDAREPDARCATSRSTHGIREKERNRADGSERRTWSHGASGDRPHEPARCVTASSHGWRQLHRFGERLVALAKESRESETAEPPRQRDNGFAVSDGSVGSTGRQRGQAALEIEPGGTRAGARGRAGYRHAIRHAALHDVPLKDRKIGVMKI